MPLHVTQLLQLNVLYAVPSSSDTRLRKSSDMMHGCSSAAAPTNVLANFLALFHVHPTGALADTEAVVGFALLQNKCNKEPKMSTRVNKSVRCCSRIQCSCETAGSDEFQTLRESRMHNYIALLGGQRGME